MTDDERERYDGMRFAYTHGLTNLKTPQLLNAHRALSTCYAELAGASSTARCGVVISGEAFVGKSTAMMSWGRRVELALRKQRSLPLPDDPAAAPPRVPSHDGDSTGEYLPVAYAAVGISVGATVRNLIRFYNPELPNKSRGDIDATIALVCRYIKDCQTAVVLVDQLHEISHAVRGPAETSEVLKALTDRSPSTMFAAAAIGIDELKIFTDGYTELERNLGQTGGRFSLHQMNTYNIHDEDGMSNWQEFLLTVDRDLMLMRSAPGDLLKHADYIFDRTAGVTGAVMQLVRTAAGISILNHDERITQRLMGEVDLSYFAEVQAGRTNRTRPERSSSRAPARARSRKPRGASLLATKPANPRS
ncbi:hypothetical protein [Georgenia subflava]|nr:hypothetical protein [Georgenia subflava]